ncbi:MAG: membrane protein insertase YidC [Candidatus Zixiibacteriota bacterium]
MVDKKTLPLIILLVILILFYFPIMEYLGFYKPAKRELSEKPPPTSVDSSDQSLVEQGSLDTSVEPIREVPQPLGALSQQEPVGSLSSDTIIVHTSKYSVTLTSFGGGPVSLLLHDYTYRDKRPVQMLPDAEFATPEATFAGGTFSTSHVNFTSNLPPGIHDATREPLEVVYTYGEPQQGQIIRRYRFYPDRYHFDLTVEVINPEKLGFERQYYLIWNTPLGVTEPQPETDYNAMEAVAMMGGSRVKLDDFEDDRLNQSETGYTTWAGVRSKYFAAILIPKNRSADGAMARGEKKKVSTPKGRIEQRQITAGLEMAFANVSSVADTFTVFVGPLDYTIMSRYKVDLEDMLGIGTTPFIGWIIKPFAVAVIWLLPKMYSFFANYGVVIILFALLVKIITLPLSLKSFKSMNAMKELQPKIEELKKKHKKNPQALNAEMMRLYKKHGVNPMSGCLPMLLQMPLFFALFSVFRSTILLRDAPFVWFITDLSRGATSLTDPYIILVVIMVATQFISQRFTMATTTQQNKIFLYIFPLFMGWLLYKFPAGLVLYWTCFSVFSLLDYALFKRKKSMPIKTA